MIEYYNIILVIISKNEIKIKRGIRKIRFETSLILVQQCRREI